MFSWKDVPRGTFSIANVITVAVVAKVLFSDIEVASAFLLFPIVAMQVANVLVHDAKMDLDRKISVLDGKIGLLEMQFDTLNMKHSQSVESFRNLEKATVEQLNTMQSLVSKSNLASAFTPMQKR